MVKRKSHARLGSPPHQAGAGGQIAPHVDGHAAVPAQGHPFADRDLRGVPLGLQRGREGAGEPMGGAGLERLQGSWRPLHGGARGGPGTSNARTLYRVFFDEGWSKVREGIL